MHAESASESILTPKSTLEPTLTPESASEPTHTCELPLLLPPVLESVWEFPQTKRLLEYSPVMAPAPDQSQVPALVPEHSPVPALSSVTYSVTILRLHPSHQELQFPESILVPTCTQSAIITPATDYHLIKTHIEAVTLLFTIVWSCHSCLKQLPVYLPVWNLPVRSSSNISHLPSASVIWLTISSSTDKTVILSYFNYNYHLTSLVCTNLLNKPAVWKLHMLHPFVVLHPFPILKIHLKYKICSHCQMQKR